MENKANNEENSGGNCQEEHEDSVLFACRGLHQFPFFRPGVINSNLEMSSVNFHYIGNHLFFISALAYKGGPRMAWLPLEFPGSYIFT